jgi:hypothetical protein
MEAFSFPGTYEDDRGAEAVRWRIRQASDRAGQAGTRSGPRSAASTCGELTSTA